MPFTSFGDFYSFWMRSGVLSGDWAGWFLSDAPTGLPTVRLISQQSL